MMEGYVRRRWGDGVLCMFMGLAVLVGWMALCRISYGSYQEKCALLYRAVESEASGEMFLPWAARILKGSERVDFPEVLQEYGYTQEFMNAFRKEFYGNCAGITLVCVCVLAVLFLLMFRKRKDCRCQVEEELGYVAHAIAQIRDGTETGLSHPQTVKWLCRMEEANSGAALVRELTSLADYFRLVTEQASREKEETKTLVTDISHQLRMPVAALRASLDVLKEPSLAETERREFLGQSVEQAQRLSELLEALIQISRMETGVIKVHREMAPIFETILQSVNRIYPKADEKQIEIILSEENWEEGELRTLAIPQDRKWLSEALINILENAVKYSPQGSRIAIRLERRTTFLRLEIEDEGIGVARSERSRIFQRFYRGSAKQVQQESGSGVGLYLTREIMEQHNGTIYVRNSGSGAGSVFVLQLPYEI